MSTDYAKVKTIVKSIKELIVAVMILLYLSEHIYLQYLFYFILQFL